MRIHKLFCSCFPINTQLCQANKQTNQVRHKRKDERKRGEEKARVFENRFISGGEENERRMENNVMQEMRIYDGYLVCLDLA